MLSSGITAVFTSTAANTDLILNPNGYGCNYLTIINEGGVAGFFSVDGGATWGRVMATGATVVRERFNGKVIIKRDGNNNMTGIYAFAGNLDNRG